MWQLLVNIGISDKLPDYLRSRVRFSNRILFFFLVATLADLLLSPPGQRLIFGGEYMLGVGVACFMLNAAGLSVFTRLTMATVSVAMALLPGLLATPQGEFPPAYIFVLALGLSSCAFTLFGTQEQLWVYAACILNAVMIAFCPLLAGRLGPLPDDYDLLYAPVRQATWIGVGVALIYGTTLTLTALQQKVRRRTQGMLNELNDNTHALVQREQELQNTLKEIEEARAQEAQRTWAGEALAHINAMLRGNTDLEQLYAPLLAEVVKQMGVQMGALFVRHDTEPAPYMALCATYAAGRNKFLQKQVALGEGLVGNCWFEQMPLYLTHLPEDQTEIATGLANMKPRAMLLQPLIFNQSVEGVLELASLAPIAPHQRELVEKICEAMAASMASQRLAKRTQTLLDASEKQRNELRQQEEEMRQNYEELQATQEEMRRKEAAYLQKIAELEASLHALSLVGSE